MGNPIKSVTLASNNFIILNREPKTFKVSFYIGRIICQAAQQRPKKTGYLYDYLKIIFLFVNTTPINLTKS